MLNSFFISIINMSIVSSYVISFVLIVRLLLKKAPKIFSFALWAVVLFRLLCPFSFESVLSILPNNIAPISQDILYSQAPQMDTGIGIVDNSVNPILPIPNMGDSVNPLQVWSFIGSLIWITGIIVLLIYSIAAFIKLKRKLRVSTPLRDHIYLTDHISSPFVMGIIKPKIYLPSLLSRNEQGFIIAHEAYHIKRFDHITRILAFIALAFHWFNPLVWIAFILSGKDMELSCDEAVTKQMDQDIRAEYTQSLLRFATGKKMLHATPLAFGEGDTKSRVKNVLNYKKPAFWVLVVSVIAVVAVGVGLLANPKEKPTGFAGINAIILEIDKANLSMTVKGTDRNNAIGDNCILDLKEASLITVTTNSEPKSLSLDAFAAGDTVVLFINEIQESYPTKAKATTVQLVATAPMFERDYFIMTDEIGAIGCEYAVNKDNQLDTLQMLSALETLNGFNFDTDWASHGYIEFVFNDKKPKDIFLRYCANVDEIWQQEYPIDSADYNIKVPPKTGIYNFFADITWENGEKETAYFSVTVAEKLSEGLTHDQAVASALFSLSDRYLKGECISEGHIILGYDDSDKNKTKIYALTEIGWYGFENNNFAYVSGSAFPAVITLSSDNTAQIELPLDGSDYSASIEKMFPKEYHDRILKYDNIERENLKQQREKYASKYLSKIGRNAKIGEYSDFKYTSLTDEGVSVEVSNKLQDFYKAHSYYPSFIGTREQLENGGRMVYEMSYRKNQDEISFIKYGYETKRILEQFTADAKTGNIVE